MISLLLGGGKFSSENIATLSQMIMVYAISVPLESMLHIYHRAFYSLKNTVIPSLMHAFSISLTIIMAVKLSSTIGVFAIPTSFTLGLILHILVLAIAFPHLLKKDEPKLAFSAYIIGSKIGSVIFFCDEYAVR